MPERVLKFPGDAEVGILHAYHGKSQVLTVPARGHVSVPSDAVVDLRLNSPACGLEDLAADDIYAVGIAKKVAADADLKTLAHLTGLRELCCSKAYITDEGLEHLARLTRLRSLDLYATRVTDNGLAYLAGMVELEYLHLGRTGVKGSGLGYLGRLQRLEWLSLEETDVDDSIVPGLMALRSLRRVALWGTRLSTKDVAALRAAIPGEVAIRDPGRRLAAERSQKALLMILAHRLGAEIPPEVSVEDVLGRLLPPGSKLTEWWEPGEDKPLNLGIGLPLDDFVKSSLWLGHLPMGCNIRVVTPAGLDVWIPWLRHRREDRQLTAGAARAARCTEPVSSPAPEVRGHACEAWPGASCRSRRTPLTASVPSPPTDLLSFRAKGPERLWSLLVEKYLRFFDEHPMLLKAEASWSGSDGLVESIPSPLLSMKPAQGLALFREANPGNPNPTIREVEKMSDHDAALMVLSMFEPD